MAEALVSVVIPTYRHARYVGDTLASVFAQTLAPSEVIVVNDGSPDDTERVLRPFADAGRIRYVAQENAGQAAARNRGISLARGRYVALLDDDDLWPPDKLEWQVAALEAHPDAALVYGPAVTIDDSGSEVAPRDENGDPVVLPWEAPGGRAYASFIRRNWILSPGQCLLRGESLRALTGGSPFDPDPALRGCDDWDLWLRLLERHPFLAEERAALRYRFHASNASRDTLQMHRATLATLRKQRARCRPEDRAAVEDAYAAALEWSAHDLLTRARHDRTREGAPDPRGALRKLLFLGRTQPTYWTRPSFLRQVAGACRQAARAPKNGGGGAGAAPVH